MTAACLAVCYGARAAQLRLLQALKGVWLSAEDKRLWAGFCLDVRKQKHRRPRQLEGTQLFRCVLRCRY